MDMNTANMFELSLTIHKLAGKTENAGWDAVENQLKLVREEFEELEASIHARDSHQLRDAIGDLLMTVYGAAWRAGLDADEDLIAIFESNMTKFDRDEGTARRTREKYAQMGLEVETIGIPHGILLYYATRVTYEQTVNGKLYPRGKLVKSVNFQEPVFSPLPAEVARQLNSHAHTSGDA